MGFFTGGNHGIAKSSPKDYTKNTPKPAIYGRIKDWVHATDFGPGYSGDFGSWSGFGGDVHWQDNPHANEGWFPVWGQDGGTPDPNTPLTPEEQAAKQQAELSNPDSKYYTDYYKKLKGTLSAQSSLNSLLGLNRAMGLSMTGSATIANEQRNALEGKITDYAGQSTKDLFQANTQGVNSLISAQMGNNQFYAQLGQNQSQYNQTRSDSQWQNNMFLLNNLANQFKDLFKPNTQVGSYWDMYNH